MKTFFFLCALCASAVMTSESFAQRDAVKLGEALNAEKLSVERKALREKPGLKARPFSLKAQGSEPTRAQGALEIEVRREMKGGAK